MTGKAALKEYLRGLAKSSKPCYVSSSRLELEFDLCERTVREVIADLGVEHISFVPLRDPRAKGLYALHVDGFNDALFNTELRRTIKSVKSVFKKRLNPYRGYIKDAKMAQVVDRLFETLDMVE